jgi:hypothetical protein
LKTALWALVAIAQKRRRYWRSRMEFIWVEV